MDLTTSLFNYMVLWSTWVEDSKFTFIDFIVQKHLEIQWRDHTIYEVIETKGVSPFGHWHGSWKWQILEIPSKVPVESPHSGTLWLNSTMFATWCMVHLALYIYIDAPLPTVPIENNTNHPLAQYWFTMLVASNTTTVHCKIHGSLPLHKIWYLVFD